MPAPPGPVIVTSRALGSSSSAFDPRERVVPADEPVVERREARCRERLERREVVAETGRDELEELDRRRNVLQPVAAERPDTTRPEAARRRETSRVACETTTCSPCADAQIRAAITTSMPT